MLIDRSRLCPGDQVIALHAPWGIGRVIRESHLNRLISGYDVEFCGGRVMFLYRDGLAKTVAQELIDAHKAFKCGDKVVVRGSNLSQTSSGVSEVNLLSWKKVTASKLGCIGSVKSTLGGIVFVEFYDGGRMPFSHLELEKTAAQELIDVYRERRSCDRAAGV